MRRSTGHALALLLPASLAAQGFTQLTAPQGIHSVPHTTSQYGSGVGICDINGDGLVDVIVLPADGGAFGVYRNDGNMQFTDVSPTAGLGSHGQARCVQCADVDNDGDQDIYVGGANEHGKLFINDGTGVFTEEAALRGLDAAEDNFAASFGDFDRDGWIDLAIGNRVNFNGASPGGNRLYRNTGNGFFVDTGNAVPWTAPRLTFALAFLDFNEDMWPDIIEVNERGAAVGPNELYVNNGDGTFTAVGGLYNANQGIDGMGVDFVDVFNDGGLDIYMTDILPDDLFLQWDPNFNAYSDQTYTYGLQGTFESWCANFLDYDNDGWQDLHVVQITLGNLLMRNPGTPAAAQTPWTDTAAQLGLDQAYTQRTSSTADFDNDGKLDILQRFQASSGPLHAPEGLTIHRNNVVGGNWVKLSLTGTSSNRDGLGARIDVEAAGMTQRQYRRSGIGFIGESDHRLHFGVGTATTIDRISITWPSGQKQFLTNVAPNQILEISEPQITCAGPATPGGSTTVTCSIPGDEGLLYIMPLSLGTTFGTPLPDNLLFPLDNDSVLDYTIDINNPIFTGSVGLLDANGEATATFNVPNLPWLSGLVLYSSALTIDTPTFTLVRSIINQPVEVPIQ